MRNFLLWVSGLQAHQAALIGACFAALIGAISTVLSGLLRDFLAKSWSDKRDHQKSAEEVFRSYAEPLASAMTGLYWRLNEMVSGDGRASFLTAKEPRNDFDQYKLRSTYFRLAAVLGWLRALRRELSFLRTYGQKRIGKLDAALDAFEKSLADGHEVEIQRLHGLQELWGIPKIKDARTEERAAIAVEDRIDRALHGEIATLAAGLESATQLKLCRELADLIAKESDSKEIQAAVLKETQARSVCQIDIRQAWLYRDWQTAIGDMVIRETKAANRNFEVIGYGEFEEMLLGPTKAQYRSLSRISALFHGVDFERKDLYDARPAAIHKLLDATAALIAALADARISKDAVDSVTAKKARATLAGLTKIKKGIFSGWWDRWPSWRSPSPPHPQTSSPHQTHSPR